MSDPAVRLHVLKGPRLPETTGHPFLCEHFRGTLTGSECLRRQTLRIKAPAQAKDKSTRVPQHLEYCAGGKCDQGAEIAKTFPDWKPEERPPMDWAAQWTAKRRHDGVDAPLLGPAPSVAPATIKEKPMEGKTTCAESGCGRPTKTKGLCGMHYQRALAAAKNGKPAVPKLAGVKSSAERLTGQDEFDLMIAIRDSFRKLSEPGKLYVLAALELRK